MRCPYFAGAQYKTRSRTGQSVQRSVAQRHAAHQERCPWLWVGGALKTGVRIAGRCLIGSEHKKRLPCGRATDALLTGTSTSPRVKRIKRPTAKARISAVKVSTQENGRPRNERSTYSTMTLVYNYKVFVNYPISYMKHTVYDRV